METDEGGAKDPTARRRRIAERGSDRLALITSARAPTAPPPPAPSPTSSSSSHHSSTSSCPPSLTRLDHLLPSGISRFGDEDKDENREVRAETAAVTKPQPVLRKSESVKNKPIPNYAPSSPNKSTPKIALKSDLAIYLLKTLGPNQLRLAILASQDFRRKFSFMAGIIALMSHLRIPILGSFIIRNIILSWPLFQLMVISISIAIGPLVLDATKMIGQEGNASAGEADLADQLSLAFESGMLLKTSFSSFFMDFCIYSVVVVCGMAFLQKFGL